MSAAIEVTSYHDVIRLTNSPAQRDTTRRDGVSKANVDSSFVTVQLSRTHVGALCLVRDYFESLHLPKMLLSSLPLVVGFLTQVKKTVNLSSCVAFTLHRCIVKLAQPCTKQACTLTAYTCLQTDQVLLQTLSVQSKTAFCHI